MKNSLQRRTQLDAPTKSLTSRIHDLVGGFRSKVASLGLVALGAIAALSGCNTPAPRQARARVDAAAPIAVQSDTSRSINAPQPPVTSPEAPEVVSAITAVPTDITDDANKFGSHSVLRGNGMHASPESGAIGSLFAGFEGINDAHALAHAQTLASLLNPVMMSARATALASTHGTTQEGQTLKQTLRHRSEGIRTHVDIHSADDSDQITVYRKNVNGTFYYQVVATTHDGAELWKTGVTTEASLTHANGHAHASIARAPSHIRTRVAGTRRSASGPVAVAPVAVPPGAVPPNLAGQNAEAPRAVERAPIQHFHRYEVAEMRPTVDALNNDPTLSPYLHFAVVASETPVQQDRLQAAPASLVISVHHGVTPGQPNARWNLEGHADIQYPLSVRTVTATNGDHSNTVVAPYANLSNALTPINASRLLSYDLDHSQGALVNHYRIPQFNTIFADYFTDTPRIPVTEEDVAVVREANQHRLANQPYSQAELDQMARRAGQRWADRYIRNFSTTGTHRSKGFVTRSIQEGYGLAIFQFHRIGTDVLGNTSGFTGNNIRFPDIIE